MPESASEPSVAYAESVSSQGLLEGQYANTPAWRGSSEPSPTRPCGEQAPVWPVAHSSPMRLLLLKNTQALGPLEAQEASKGKVP